MLTASASSAVEGADGWTIRTQNGCLAVHEEHTIVITNRMAIVVTAA
jgi:methionine aminopeptidase